MSPGATPAPPVPTARSEARGARAIVLAGSLPGAAPAWPSRDAISPSSRRRRPDVAPSPTGETGFTGGRTWRTFCAGYRLPSRRHQPWIDRAHGREGHRSAHFQVVVSKAMGDAPFLPTVAAIEAFSGCFNLFSGPEMRRWNSCGSWSGVVFGRQNRARGARARRISSPQIR